MLEKHRNTTLAVGLGAMLGYSFMAGVLLEPVVRNTLSRFDRRIPVASGARAEQDTLRYTVAEETAHATEFMLTTRNADGWDWRHAVCLSDYLGYKNRTHRFDTGRDFLNYVTPEDSAIQNLAAFLTARAPSREVAAQRILDFMHQKLYVPDHNGEYVKYPLETLVEGGGDCEDLSILGASLMRASEIDVSLLYFGNHLAIGVHGNFSGTFWQIDGRPYYYAEPGATIWPSTPARWNIGEAPETFQKVSPHIFPIR